MKRNIFKWDNDGQRCIQHSVPESWHITIIEPNLGNKCNCASCGKEMTFGEGYTSRIYQTAHGFGYCVCKDCYYKEEDA